MNENRAPTRRGGSPRLGAVVATFPIGRAAHHRGGTSGKRSLQDAARRKVDSTQDL